jgi:hypothetical protein
MNKEELDVNYVPKSPKIYVVFSVQINSPVKSVVTHLNLLRVGVKMLHRVG